MDGSAKRIKATYDFAVQTHATIGPSCAVADFQDGKLTVWTSSQATHSMQHELAVITGLSREAIRLVFIEGAGCYGRNGTEDAAADAALIAMLIGKPVRVQWSRADETARSPKSPPRTMDLEAGLDAQGNVVAWTGDFYIALNHIAAFKPLDFPLLAATETGIPRPGNWVGFLFQNSGQPYQFPNIRVNTRHIAEAFFRSSHLRSPGRIENSFANEGFMDELAAAAKADPAEFRLRYLKDPRAIDVLQAAMKLAGWQARPGPNPNAGSGPVVKGRGIAYLRYNNAITYVAAVAEVEVNKRSGEIRVTRVCASHDCGEMVNPDGVANQVEGGVLQTVSRTLMETVTWDRNKVKSVDWATYPIMRFPAAPKVEIALIDRPGTVAWGAGEPTACAIPAAIANAVFDATGARLALGPVHAGQGEGGAGGDFNRSGVKGSTHAARTVRSPPLRREVGGQRPPSEGDLIAGTLRPKSSGPRGDQMPSTTIVSGKTYTHRDGWIRVPGGAVAVRLPDGYNGRLGNKSVFKILSADRRISVLPALPRRGDAGRARLDQQAVRARRPADGSGRASADQEWGALPSLRGRFLCCVQGREARRERARNILFDCRKPRARCDAHGLHAAPSGQRVV